ncbi:helicase SNF [Halolactibacillus alkaliphilus]|uniref:Helicase SNF n=1 Tax=Halolactibacillus alkaliphilus TaxID=442899 RepID=A0A511X0Q8_9BACI|nr:DEAD/DEAH box helicase [Halolactibacillus alkaliphilus]GEN56529.1 helicase SNF [Halolactibacillus alkaliphilus]GGN69408.1 helicase SNF [Halolactibacillus alkaliphilus]SFO74813.1 Superfamily II DNA or RNA helicase, SNF2 family [Halolactibacillus alkaliphilus]
MPRMIFEPKEIMKLTGQRFYRRGLDYYKKGRVNHLSYNQAINMWKADVRGSENFHVNIFVYDDYDIETRCTCPAFHTHGTCKHIAAVLLAISKHQQPHLESMEPDRKKSDPYSLRLLDAFKQTTLTHDKEVLQVHYQISEVSPSFTEEKRIVIGLHVGETKPFIIKDIREFIEATYYKQSYAITEKFTYQPEKHTFTKTDKEILRLLQQALIHERTYKDLYTDQQQRLIIVPPYVFKDLFAYIQTQSLTLKTDNQKEYSNLSLEPLDGQMTFTIDTNAEGQIIHFDDFLSYRYLPYYQVFIKKAHFFTLTDAQAAIVNTMMKQMPRQLSQQLLISPSDFQGYLTYVKPMLESIGTVKITDAVKDRLYEAPLEAHLYLEFIGESLGITVDYQYGDYRFSFNSSTKETEQIVVRDVKEEERIIEHLRQFGFQYVNQRFQLFHVDKIYDFILDVVPELKQVYHVYLSDQLKTLVNEEAIQFDPSIRFNDRLNVLAIDFDIAGINDQDLHELMKALIEKKRYYRPKQGPIVDLEDEAFKQFKAFAESLKLKASHVKKDGINLSPAHATIVDDYFRDTTQYETSFQTLMNDLSNQTNKTYPLPAIQADLRDYQYVGYQWFKALSTYHLGGILADEMGLGKTLQTITYILSDYEEKNNTKSLIVAPSSLIYNWKKEFERFASELSIQVVTGSQAERKSILNHTTADVLITSYPLLRQDIKHYEGISFTHFILDEAQAIKNHLTQTAKAARAIVATHRFALSGTPIENRLEELWSIFQTLSPGFLGTKKYFLSLDTVAIKQMVRPFILRRLKTDVLKDLPEKFEYEKYTDLTTEQKQVYLMYVNKIKDTINQGAFNENKLDILSGLTRLRQICCHPSLFLENYSGHSGKLELLTTLLTQLKEENRRVLLFSQFPSMLKIIAENLPSLGLDHFFLDGQTPSLERLEKVDRFNQGEKDLFLISLKAGGTGLNLTGADTVILFDLWWNPAVEQQAAGRAHRIGQTKKVEVIRLITEGTIEEKIFNLQQKKRALVNEIIEPGETLLSSLTKDDILSLLSVDTEL